MVLYGSQYPVLSLEYCTFLVAQIVLLTTESRGLMVLFSLVQMKPSQLTTT